MVTAMRIAVALNTGADGEDTIFIIEALHERDRLSHGRRGGLLCW